MRRFFQNAPFFTLPFGALTLAIVLVGHLTANAPPADFEGWVELLLDAAQLFTLERPEDRDGFTWVLGRLLGLGTVGLGVFEVFGRLFPTLIRQGRRALLDVLRPFTRGHVVVSGLGAVGHELVLGLLAEGKRVVAIDRAGADWRMDDVERRGVAVITGDATDPATLRQARIARASEIYCVAREDVTNLEVMGQVAKLTERASPGPICFPSLSSRGMLDAVRRSTLLSEVLPLEVRPFDLLQSRARALVVRDLVQHAPKAHQVAHYLVIGFGPLARSFVEEAGALAHFRNRKRLRMTVLAPLGAVKDELAEFLDLHPGFCPDPSTFSIEGLVATERPDDWGNRAFRPARALWQIADPRAVEYAVNAEFVDWGYGLFGAEVRAAVNALALPHVAPCVVVCDADPQRNIEYALRLHQMLRDQRVEAPIYVYLAEEDALTTVIAKVPGLHAFGPTEPQALVDEIRRPRSEPIARAFHEAYRTQNPAEKPWERLDHDLRASNIDAAAHVDVKLADAGLVRGKAVRGIPGITAFDDQVRLELAEVEHNRWMAERLIGGWRFGPRAPGEKLRDTLVPWAVLPQAERDKDLAQVDLILPAIVQSLGESVTQR